MRILKRAVPLSLLAALLLVIAAACGGSGGEPAGDHSSAGQAAGDQSSDKLAGSEISDKPGGDVSKPLVANATDVLGASASAFEQDVTSLRAAMEFSIDAGGFAMAGSADFAYQAPDKMHMTMELSGSGGDEMMADLGELGNMEMLLLGQEIYMNTPFTGWVVMSMDDLGVDAEQFQTMLADHSPVDYQAMIDQMGGQVEDLGQESLDGGSYNHYRVSMDMADIMNALSEAFGADSGITTQGLFGSSPITMDIWVDPDTFLPYKMTMNGTFEAGAEAMAFDMTVRFLEYNGAVSIPAPPADAQPAGSLLGLFDEAGWEN